jgi:transcriptional regulator with XRE-family HTH domain
MKRAKKKVSPRTATAVDTYIGTQMRNGRAGLGLSQEALGEKLGVSFQQVQKYEKGINRVSAARLFEICKALKIPLASMFERDPAAQPVAIKETVSET